MSSRTTKSRPTGSRSGCRRPLAQRGPWSSCGHCSGPQDSCVGTQQRRSRPEPPCPRVGATLDRSETRRSALSRAFHLHLGTIISRPGDHRPLIEFGLTRQCPTQHSRWRSRSANAVPEPHGCGSGTTPADHERSQPLISTRPCDGTRCGVRGATGPQAVAWHPAVTVVVDGRAPASGTVARGTTELGSAPHPATPQRGRGWRTDGLHGRPRHAPEAIRPGPGTARQRDTGRPILTCPLHDHLRLGGGGGTGPDGMRPPSAPVVPPGRHRYSVCGRPVVPYRAVRSARPVSARYSR